MVESLKSIYQRYFDETLFGQKNGVTYNLRPEIGAGNACKVTTYSGIEIVYHDIRYHEPYPFCFASRGRMVELQFTLSGGRQVNVSGHDHETPVGQGALALIQDFQAQFYPSAQEPYVSLSLAIPVSLFDYAAHELTTSTNTNFEFDRLLQGQTFRRYCFENDARSMVLAKQLISDFKDANRSPLLMEASALELLNMYMLQLFEPSPRPGGLSKGDIQKLHRAKEILESCMTDPPSLLALAKMVGLNDFKLKTGFKACFGMTVFEYLRHVRLEHAMMVLRNQESNVTETAMMVGYSNVSAFSEQFIRKFGIKPSEIKKYF
ncbi:helix-turn-helix transcriptional regulator [Paenibacillus sp. 32352]|uniref:helix-turn-helix transcriptional regulator n=1 Tax=Paenibacillus sp. 32352 TaxID=1969111 RepID=UPI0009ADA6BC|nr:AraC family transcriptional regulator [Paenibacillus sp. 32352]